MPADYRDLDDDELAEAVRERIVAHDDPDLASVDVRCHGGVVRLSGEVPSEPQRRVLAQLVADGSSINPYLDQTKVLTACKSFGLALVAYSPVAKGRVKNAEALNRIGERYDKTAAQVCLRWLIQQNVVAIPGTSKVERLSENIDVFDFKLTDAEMDEIFAMGTRQGRIVDFGFAPQWD